MQTMYPGQPNSPQTELASAIDNQQTTIPLLDASKLPPAPNIATIGTGEDAETILYTGVSGNDLTGVTRGFQGAAKAWVQGTKVARYFTAYDYDALRQNVADHEAATTGVHGATSEATPNTIVQRDAQGRIKAAAPSAADDVARKAEIDAHAADITSHVSFLSANQYTAAEPVTSYPLGVSVMRVTNSDFPNINGTVLTVKGTSGTGFQIFVSTTSSIGSYFRGSTTEVWKDWEPVVKSGTTLWSGNAYQAGTVLNLSGNLNDFSYLIAIVDLVGYETRLIYHKESSTYLIKGFNLIDDGVTPTLSQAEIRLSRTSDTSLTIDHNYRWRWTGNAADNATMFSNDSGFNIRKIIGVV